MNIGQVLRASFMWDELSCGKLSLTRVVLHPQDGDM